MLGTPEHLLARAGLIDAIGTPSEKLLRLFGRDPGTPYPTRDSPSVLTAGRAIQWQVFGLADVLTARSISRPEVVAESGTAQDVSEAVRGRQAPSNRLLCE
jgi:hypothetical protein